jgi:hypothetical protein
VLNHRKPHVQSPVVSHYPARAPFRDFVLPFLPPCGPHLTLLDIGSLKPSLLVSPLLGGPARHRPFVISLHLHQSKSSRNLHLQYSAKSQSTPCCKSHIIARSDHQPVLGSSGPQRFGSSLPVKGECCTMQIVEVLISNGLPISAMFKIGRSTMSAVHSSPILHFSCGCSPVSTGGS